MRTLTDSLTNAVTRQSLQILFKVSAVAAMKCGRLVFFFVIGCFGGGCESYTGLSDRYVVVTPGVGVSCLCEIGISWERFVEVFKGMYDCADSEFSVKLSKYEMTLYFTPPNKSGDRICYMMSFGVPSPWVRIFDTERVILPWSVGLRFRWEDVYGRFGIPRKIPAEKFNVLGGLYPCCIESHTEKWVHYANEGISFRGNVDSDFVDEVFILKRLGQTWDERIQDAEQNLMVLSEGRRVF